METRQLGHSDLKITRIGFGAWATGGPWQFGWGQQDDEASIAAIHRALELGSNWIDTAAIYGLGHSEEVVGRALAEWRGARPLVFTKCGMIWDENGKVGYSTKAPSIRREIEAEVLPFCATNGIGTIVYSPMGSGLLTGAFTRERVDGLPEGDWRRKSAAFQEPQLTANLQLVERMRAVGCRQGRSPAEVAIAWVLRNPAVTGAIVGARGPEQVEGTFSAATLALTPADVSSIEAQA